MELPLIQVIGPDEVQQFFDAVYAVLYPVMPLIMIGLATAFAAYLITVVRRVFSFSNYDKKREDYDDYEDD